jgi:VanZ family protein
MTRPSSRTRAVFLAGLLVSLLAFLQFFRPPEDTLLWISFLDAGHVPLFGVFAVVVLALFPRGAHPLRRYVVAFGVTAVVALLVEVSQYFTPRDADIVDWIRGLAGTLAFLLVALVFDGKALRALPGRRGRLRGVLVAAAAAILAAAFASFAGLSIAYLERGRSFPRICDFESAWESTFYKTAYGAELTVVPPPPGWEQAHGHRVGRLTFLYGKYPGFHLREMAPDWRGYDRLCLDIYSENRSARTLELGVRDRRPYDDYTDQFNRTLTIHPGLNAVCIPLSEIRTGPKDRVMDMSRMARLTLFAVRPDTAFTVYLDGIRLEGAGQ